MKFLIPLVVIGVGVICIALSFYVFIYKKGSVQKIVSSVPLFRGELLRLSYADLLKATRGFSEENLLGAGRFGSVFRGVLANANMPVAVKVLNLEIRGASKSFLSECNAIRGMRHRNLLKILTVCESTDFRGNDFKALVYEFMSNNSLEKWLHQNAEEETGVSRNLSLIQRLNIAIDIATAVEYLHHGTDSIVVHGDLKPGNILLDENMIVHVGDFGLAKVLSIISQAYESGSTTIKGTIGYIPPEYCMSNIFSAEGDVYSYGILLLEIFTNKRPTDADAESTLHDLVCNALLGQVIEIVDPIIIQEDNHNINSKVENCMISIFKIGVACSLESPRDRMQMTDVVSQLKKIKNTYTAE